MPDAGEPERPTFSRVPHGYDPAEVDAHLVELTTRLRIARGRIERLEADLRRLRRGASPTPPTPSVEAREEAARLVAEARRLRDRAAAETERLLDELRSLRRRLAETERVAAAERLIVDLTDVERAVVELAEPNRASRYRSRSALLPRLGATADEIHGELRTLRPEGL
ncbi:MAG TPA: hypothetical protein ENK55_06330 [Actinobacteria bacterium]|nr:hypothetical protein [Actinomycetota bacterium]